MATYAEIYAAATDEAFQARCRAALWEQANKVANGDEGFPAAGQAHASNADEDRLYALAVLRDQARLTDRVLAMQVLRNSSIAANPAASADADILWQLNNGSWAELRSIG
jgi:hypothetical protein